MDNNWATHHLETIRTLMERTALYRRALAPISTFAGVVGIAAAIAGQGLKIESAGAFAVYWMAVAVGVLAGSFFLVRRQASKQGENFWSPPTRRVAHAMAPALLVGLGFGLVFASGEWQTGTAAISVLLVLVWTFLYGLALHAAGFFMLRGIRMFGWAFIIAGMLLLVSFMRTSLVNPNFSPHWLMGIVFGASHLAYGIYLYFTEPRKNEA